MHRRALIVIPLAALAFAGCGEDNDEGSAGTTGTGTGTQAEEPSGPSPQTVDISETEFKIAPANVTGAKPGVVVFNVTNDGGVPHALEVEGAGLEEETEEIAPGQSASLEVDLPEGTYELYCPIDGHKDKGMEAALTVGESSGAAVDDSEGEEEQGEGDSGSDDSLEGEAEGKGKGEDSGGATAPGGGY